MQSNKTKDDYEMELDEDFYNKLLHADFFELDGMIFVKGLVNKFDEIFKECKKEGMNKTEIEKYLNHVPMEFISTVPERQNKYGQDIIATWKKKLANQFPKKKFNVHLNEGNDKNLELYTL